MAPPSFETKVFAQLPKPAAESNEIDQHINKLWQTYDSGQIEKAFERILDLPVVEIETL